MTTEPGAVGTLFRKDLEKKSSLGRLFERFPRLAATFGEQEIYQHFRVLEPQLVSVLDEVPLRPEPDILVLRLEGHPAGVTSFLVETNVQRPAPPRKYARIDLVITEPDARGLGVGRLMLLSVLIHLLETEGTNLYSISCLAAHPAIEHVLGQLDFGEKPSADHGLHAEAQQYKHMEIRLDQSTLEDYKRKVLVKTSEALRVINYRLRQSGLKFEAGAEEDRQERFRHRQKHAPAIAQQL